MSSLFLISSVFVFTVGSDSSVPDLDLTQNVKATTHISLRDQLHCDVHV